MSIEPIPVWSLPVDWKDGTTESWEFLTTVGESAGGIEQRRGVRLTPRQYFEYSYILQGPERTYFDLLTMRSGGSFCYLPMWHDVELLVVEHTAGMTALGINTTYTEFMNCDAVFIGSTHDYELAEIVGRADAVVTLTGPLVNTWPARTRVVPLKKVRLEQQPTTTRRSELVHVARVKFCSVENNGSDAENPLNSFGLQYVLEQDPNEVTDLTYVYERLLSTLDNTTGLPTVADVTGRVLQQFAFWLKGRQALHRFRGMLYALDGRRVPVWVPTVYSDFEPVGPLGAGDLVIDVKRCGFTALGGPQPQREYILIHLQNDTRIYRRITNSVILGDGTTERLFLDATVGMDVPLSQLRRISFLVLSRLDQDTVELTHHTATRGMTTATVVFRSAAAKDGIENLFEVPPGTVAPPLCLSDFIWYVHTLSNLGGIRAQRVPRQLDVHGNYYEAVSNSYNIYNQNGALLNNYTSTQLWADINAYYGFDIVGTNLQYGLFMNPFRQGKYVLAYSFGQTVPGTFDKWWTLLEPQLDGSLLVKGAVRHRNLTGPPYVNGINVMDVFDDDTIILVQDYGYVGSYYAVLHALPPINDFLDGVYEGGPTPGLIQTTFLAPIGAHNLSYYLFVLVTGNRNAGFGFRLPGNGRELFYIYINRHYMDYCVPGTGFVPPEIRDVIRPVYPFGAMLKIPLGDLSDFDALQAMHVPTGLYRGRATEPYTIDNPSWIDAEGGTAIPFLDEYTLLSSGEVGGADVYSSQVSTQLRSNGRFWCVFVMVGRDDSILRGEGLHGAFPVWAKVRLFDYDPATEVAVQIGEHVCVLRTTGDGPDVSIEALRHDYYLIAEVAETADSATIVLHGPLYRTTFCRFSLAEE